MPARPFCSSSPHLLDSWTKEQLPIKAVLPGTIRSIGTQWHMPAGACSCWIDLVEKGKGPVVINVVMDLSPFLNAKVKVRERESPLKKSILLVSWNQNLSSCHRAVSEFHSCHFSTVCMPARSLQLYLTLWDPMNCSPPGSSVHGMLQPRILGWVAMLSSRGSSQPRDGTCLFGLLQWQMGSLPLAPPREPHSTV